MFTLLWFGCLGLGVVFTVLGFRYSRRHRLYSSGHRAEINERINRLYGQ